MMRAAGGHYSRAAAAAAAAARAPPPEPAAASEQQLRAEAAARREALAAAAAAREAAEAARVRQQLQELRQQRATFRRYMQREPQPAAAAARLSLRPNVDLSDPPLPALGGDAAVGTGSSVRVVSGADLARPVPEHVRAWLQAAAAPHVRLSPATPSRPAPAADAGTPLHHATRYWGGGDNGGEQLDGGDGDGGAVDPALLLERELQAELAQAACGWPRGTAAGHCSGTRQQPIPLSGASAASARTIVHHGAREDGCDTYSDGSGGGSLSPFSISLPLGPRRAAGGGAGPAAARQPSLPQPSEQPGLPHTQPHVDITAPRAPGSGLPVPASCHPRLRPAASLRVTDDASVCSHETLTASEHAVHGATLEAVHYRENCGGGSSGATTVTCSSSHSGGCSSGISALSSYTAAAAAPASPQPPLSQVPPELAPVAAATAAAAPQRGPLPLPVLVPPSASVYQLDDTVSHPAPWGRGPQSERDAHARQALARRKEAEAQQRQAAKARTLARLQARHATVAPAAARAHSAQQRVLEEVPPPPPPLPPTLKQSAPAALPPLAVAARAASLLPPAVLSRQLPPTLTPQHLPQHQPVLSLSPPAISALLPLRHQPSPARPPPAAAAPAPDATEAALLASLAAIDAAVQERKRRAEAYVAAAAARRDSVHGSSVVSAFSVGSHGGGASSVMSAAGRTVANPPPTYPRRPRYSVRRGVLMPLAAQAPPYATVAPGFAAAASDQPPLQSHHGGDGYGGGGGRRGSQGSASVASDAVWVNPAAGGW
jgi:hypothetical protein